MSQSGIAVEEGDVRTAGAPGLEEGERGSRPTKAMRRFAEACCSIKVERDDALRAKAAGVKAETAREWRREAGFEEWLRGEVERRLSAEAWEVWLAVRKQALEGNLQAAKLFLERFDSAPAKRGDDVMPATFHALAELAHLAAQQCAETISC